MRKIGLLIIAIAVISCKKEAPVDYAILSGNIVNKGIGKLDLYSQMDVRFKKSIVIAEDGSFIDTLRVKEGVYRGYDGKNVIYVYLSAGSDIQISYDTNDIKTTLKVAGTDSEISNYLLDKKAKAKELTGDELSVYKLEEAAYKAKFGEIKTALSELVRSYEGISEDYKEKEYRGLHYNYLSKMNIYEKYHAYYAKKPGFKVSESFSNELNSELKNLDYENKEDFEHLSSYSGFVRGHFNSKASELAKAESIEWGVALLKVLVGISNETLRNTLLYENTRVKVTSIKDLESLYAVFMEGSTDEDHRKEITEKYNKLKTLVKGQPSPKFVGYENYAGGTTSLNDLKGKFVYVDIWATWCGPCKKEIPFLKEIEKKYHGKNIEFVSISIDRVKDYDKWKAMVKNEKLGGIQLFADNDWNSKFVQGYFIKGIPRFILIDTEGNIIQSRAPRPSDPELKKLLNKELGI